VLGKDDENRLSGRATELKTDTDGVIDELKVYRGTALYKVGDRVKNGDIIVGGYAEINGATVQETVVAYGVIVYERVYEYSSQNDGEEFLAKTYAEQAYPDCEYMDIRVKKMVLDNTFNYKVVLSARRVIFVG
jgi:hypothetical protein